MIDIDSLLEDQAWHRSIRHCIIHTYIHLLPAQQRPSGLKICANPAATSAWLSFPWSAVKEELDAPFLRKCSKCMMLSARTTTCVTCTKQNRNTHPTSSYYWEHRQTEASSDALWQRASSALPVWVKASSYVRLQYILWYTLCICCSDIYFHCVYATSIYK